MKILIPVKVEILGRAGSLSAHIRSLSHVEY